MAEWTIDDVEKLFSASDFSKESSLKKSLLKKIMPVREISLNELGEKTGKGQNENNFREHRIREKNAPSKEVTNTSAINNDRPMLPEGR